MLVRNPRTRPIQGLGALISPASELLATARISLIPNYLYIYLYTFRDAVYTLPFHITYIPSLPFSPRKALGAYNSRRERVRD